MTDAAGTGEALYVSRPKAYPREMPGTFQRLRKLTVLLLLGVYYGLPWLSWDGRQAVLFDLPAREFYLFGWVFLPQDFFFLALLLIVAALGLFFVTALAGRVWCGFACPQTVWTEVFLWMERWTEGDRSQRMKLDKGPWTREKLLRKSAKQVLWISFALFTGFTFVSYFTPQTVLWNELITLSLGPWESFWGLFYAFATYGNAGYMRENVCIYMCPYARFQSAMFDKDTLIITYDEKRGEPRGGRKRSADPKALGLGDCIDCTLCVQVCPTNIDIREGLQYECIGCAACIDACDQVMDKVGYPRGLIRYSTESAKQGQPVRVLRPRIVIYAMVLLFIVGALLTAISLRSPVGMEVIGDRSILYREVGDGRVENVYTLKIVNKTTRPQRYVVSVSGLADAVIETDPTDIEAPSTGVVQVPARIRVPIASLTGVSTPVVVTVETVDGKHSDSSKTRFIGPGR